MPTNFARLATPCALICAASLSLSACDDHAPQPSPNTGQTAQSVVFGVDGRADVFAHPEAAWRERARTSIVALIEDAAIDAADPNRVTLAGVGLGDAQALCPEERFRDQPTSAFCSGTLIDRDLVLTAGHCINAVSCATTSFVFDYYYEAPGQLATITADSVYHCDEIVAHENVFTGLDYAVVRLDRPVTPDRQPVEVRLVDVPMEPAAPVVVAGFPNGIPMKITDGGRVTDPRADQRDWFEANIDAFGGNSGSGVFTPEGELVGIVVRGLADYEFADGCNRVRRLPEEFPFTESSTYVYRAIAPVCVGVDAPPNFCAPTPREWCTECVDDEGCAEGFTCVASPRAPDARSCAPVCDGDEGCREDHVCLEGACTPREWLSCRQGHVWTLDFCGRDLGLNTECGELEACSGAACVARDAGDVCGNAIPIESDSQVLVHTMGAATHDTFRGTCGGLGPDVAYQFVLEAPTAFTAFSVGTFDTVLHLRASCEDAESEVVCNDDFVPPGGLGSRIATELDAGSYTLVVDHYAAQSGGAFILAVNFGGLCEMVCEPGTGACDVENGPYVCIEDERGCFVWQAEPTCEGGFECHEGVCLEPIPGDSCPTATEIETVAQQIFGETDGFRPRYVSACGGQGPERVFAFDLAITSRLTAMAAGYDTVLSLTRDCLDPSAELACNDNSDPPGNQGSAIAADLTPGRYFLRLDSWNEPGSYQLDLDFAPLCADACEIGAAQCDDSGVQTCEVGPDGCAIWSSTALCETDAYCEEGACRDATVIAVPGDAATLADAFDAAAALPGRFVVVRLPAGEFEAGLQVVRPIVLRGAGDGETVVHGGFSVPPEGGFKIADLALRGEGGVGLGTVSARLIVDGVSLHGYARAIEQTDGTLYMRNTRVTGNGWGVTLTRVLALMFNCEITYNARAGVLANGAHPQGYVDLLNNTVVGNGFGAGPDDSASAFAAEAGAGVRIWNNIVVGNRGGIECQGCLIGLGHNDVWGNMENFIGDVAATETDFSLDPRFIDPAEQDYRLAEDSPCIDRGLDIGLTYDLAGRLRPFGAGFDIGAHEFVRAELGLVINEVMANPLDEGSGEFIELLNVGDEPVDVVGLIVDDGDGLGVVRGWMDGPTELGPGGYAVVLDPDFDGDHAIAEGALWLTVDGTRISNGLATSDPVSMWTADGALVISTYDHPFNPGNGISVERIAPDAADVADNWIGSPCGASPGGPNCAGAPIEPADAALVITEVFANPIDEGTEEFVEIFNAGEADVDLAGLVLSDGDANDALVAWNEGSTVLPAGGWAVVLDRDYAETLPVAEDAVRLTVDDARLGNGIATNDAVTLRGPGDVLIAAFTHPFNPGNGRSAEMIDLARGDAADNWAGATCDVPPFATPGGPNCASDAGGIDPASLTLVINEVMANPVDEDTGEFIELYNFGDAPVNADGLLLDDGDAVDVLRPWMDGNATIPPGALAVVLDPEYADEYAIPAGTVRLRPADTTVGSGLATNDALTLLAADGRTVISTYGFPFNPGNGISVERIDDRGDVADNWIASPCPAGASPGRRNCAAGDGGVDPEPDLPALVINEVMANPVDEGAGEFVELLNVGEAPVDLAGLLISDGDATDAITAIGDAESGTGTILAAGAIAIVIDRDYDETNYAIPPDALRVTVDDRTIGSGLAVDDPVAVLMPDGVTVIATYTHPFNPGNGRSAERVDPQRGDVADNWIASPCESEPQASPGAPNCAQPGGPARGVFVDVNTADASTLQAVRGIGPVMAGRILAWRGEHGRFEHIDQLVALDGVGTATVEEWARLDADETHYLGVSTVDARPRVTFADVAALQAALPDPADSGAWPGRIVRLHRAVNLTGGDAGRAQVLTLADWGDEASYVPSRDAPAVTVVLDSELRADLTVVDGLADWDRRSGPPNGDDAFYRHGEYRLPEDRIPFHHVFAVEGVLRLERGQWQIVIRADAAPGFDRLVRIERWAPADQWRRLEFVRTYNFEPVHVALEGSETALPFRLATAHPAVAWWQAQTGRFPPIPRLDPQQMPPFPEYDEFNAALDAWRARVDIPRLVINEILYDPDHVRDTDGEFIELYNPNPDPVDLSGWRIEDDSRGHTIAADALVVPAWGYAVLGNNTEITLGDTSYIDYDYGSLSLRNTSERLRLIDPDGTNVDEVTYTEEPPWPAGVAGASLELIDPCVAHDDGALWASAIADFTGDGLYFMTPGGPNSTAASTCPEPEH